MQNSPKFKKHACFSHMERMTATESFSAYLTFRLYGRERVHGRVVLRELHYQLSRKHNTRPSLPFSTQVLREKTATAVRKRNGREQNE